MNKVKMFFIAAAMVLTTAGVFAGKAKFQAIANIYAYNGTVGYQLANGGINTTNLSKTGTTPATLNTSAGNNYGIYERTTPGGVLTYSPLYTVGF
jgi:hypothetical protein